MIRPELPDWLPLSFATVPGAARVLIVLCGVGLALAPSPVHGVAAVVTILAAVATAVRPEVVSALPPTVVFLLGWLAGGGADASPGDVRTVLAALFLYLLHQSTAFAAVVPPGATVDAAVLRRWSLRMLPALGVAALVVAFDLLLTRRSGPAVVEAVALLAVLVVVAVIVRPLLQPAGTRSGDRAAGGKRAT